MAKAKVKSGGKGSDDSKLFAFLGVFLTIIGFIIVYATRKDDKYAMYYAKQGLVMFIVWVAIAIVGMILFMIPFIGSILWLCWVVLLVFGIVYSFSGTMTPIPIVGQFADKFNF